MKEPFKNYIYSLTETEQKDIIVNKTPTELLSEAGINVEKLAHIVQSQAESTQFIVVSHRKPMIESANRTIGVTQKEKGISKVTGVKLRD